MWHPEGQRTGEQVQGRERSSVREGGGAGRPRGGCPWLLWAWGASWGRLSRADGVNQVIGGEGLGLRGRFQAAGAG